MSRGPWRRRAPPQNQITSVDSLPLVMTPEEAAKLLRCTPEYVSKMAKHGILPGFQLGNRWRFRREDILAFTVKGVSA